MSLQIFTNYTLNFSVPSQISKMSMNHGRLIFKHNWRRAEWWVFGLKITYNVMTKFEVSQSNFYDGIYTCRIFLMDSFKMNTLNNILKVVVSEAHSLHLKYSKAFYFHSFDHLFIQQAGALLYAFKWVNRPTGEFTENPINRYLIYLLINISIWLNFINTYLILVVLDYSTKHWLVKTHL